MRMIVSVLAAAICAVGPAQADTPKPKETPTEVIVINFGKLETTYRVDGSKGPDIAVQGVLHIASHALLSSDGTPVGFTLRSNLSDAFAANVDGTESYVAVSASDGIPAECQPNGCAPSFWALTFRLVAQDAALKPSLLFDLMLKTQYAADGTLVNACIAGQQDCDIGVRAP